MEAAVLTMLAALLSTDFRNKNTKPKTNTGFSSKFSFSCDIVAPVAAVAAV